ncbi:hypothetical protein Pst134EB_006362 [Puccinia striiformis f. sp. tritici]|nr:hypothetical protein Pst134EB_006362 [Puccinia striiformis f. sp. tritici]
MLSLTALLAAVAIIGFAQLPILLPTPDPATGHLRNVRPTAAWLAKNKPGKVTADIQASEFQLFAWFKQNHAQDHYHSCVSSSSSPPKIFFNATLKSILPMPCLFLALHCWAQGTGVKVISNPRTGALGYEQSLSGNFYDGAAPANSVQTLHDLNYPNFDPKAIIPWPKGAMDPFVWTGKPSRHPPSVDDHGIYSPAAAKKYPPPPNWKPDPTKTNVQTAAPPPFPTNAPHSARALANCPAAPAPAPGPAPQPHGNDPDKCHNYCTCVDQCKHDKKCIKSSCHKIKHGCESGKCSVNHTFTSDPNTPPSTPNPTSPDNPGQSSSSDPKKKKEDQKPKTGSGNQGSGNQGSGEQGSGGKGTGRNLVVKEDLVAWKGASRTPHVLMVAKMGHARADTRTTADVQGLAL